MNDQTELTSLLADLVRIDSINSDLAPGARGEGAVAAFIAEWAASAGLEAVIQEAAPGRPNVIVVAKGTGGGQNLMLNGHIDTVGTAGMAEPFSGRVEGGKLYGRGAYDMKAGVAAALMTAKRARSLNLAGNVIVACVADEELASIGSQAVLSEINRWQPDAVIVAEPTEMQLAVAHKGFVWFDIETFGVAAHGSRPHLGVDAITKMGKVLIELEKHDLKLRACTPHPHLGTGSLHAGIIQGGIEPSSYPAYCKLQVEQRTIPGETPALAEAQLQNILSGLAGADAAFKARLTRGLSRDPFEVSEDSPIVELCRAKLREVTGESATIAGVSFWADSALFSAAGLPTVLLGPRGAGAHGAEEWIELDTVQQCCDVYTAVAQSLCG